MECRSARQRRGRGGHQEQKELPDAFQVLAGTARPRCGPHHCKSDSREGDWEGAQKVAAGFNIAHNREPRNHRPTRKQRRRVLRSHTSLDKNTAIKTKKTALFVVTAVIYPLLPRPLGGDMGWPKWPAVAQNMEEMPFQDFWNWVIRSPAASSWGPLDMPCGSPEGPPEKSIHPAATLPSPHSPAAFSGQQTQEQSHLNPPSQHLPSIRTWPLSMTSGVEESQSHRCMIAWLTKLSPSMSS